MSISAGLSSIPTRALRTAQPAACARPSPWAEQRGRTLRPTKTPGLSISNRSLRGRRTLCEAAGAANAGSGGSGASGGVEDGVGEVEGSVGDNAGDEDEEMLEELSDVEGEDVDVDEASDYDDDVSPGFQIQIQVPGRRKPVQLPEVPRWAVYGPLIFLSTTFAYSVAKWRKKQTTPKAKRRKTVQANRFVVEEIDKFLPSARGKLTAGKVQNLALQAGYRKDEIFRKYLRFLINERPFDEDAVQDVLHLKSACGLSDAQVADAIAETARRSVDKYGSLMLDPVGMTADGLRRKATGRALFAKLLYLQDLDSLIAGDSPAAQTCDVAAIFGASQSDVGQLRITSLESLP